MANSSFRTFRRDATARGADSANQDIASDPLAELARLIGQSDAHGGRRRDFAPPAGPGGRHAPATDLDWAADDSYAAEDPETDRAYASSQPAEPYQAYPPEEVDGWSRDRDAPEETGSRRRLFPLLAARNEAAPDLRRQAPEAYYQDEAEASDAEPMPAIIGADGEYLDDEPGSADLGDHGNQEYEQEHEQEYEQQAESPRRGSPAVLVAMLSLAVLGSASAFGYHAVFGNSISLSLPPIIKPGNTPIKIVPKKEAQAGAPNQAGPGLRSPGDQLVPHAEKPVDVQSANPMPRMVTTIPVIPNTLAVPPPPAPPIAVAQAAPTMPAAEPSNSVGNGAAPATEASLGPPQGSKPVHTVVIKPRPSGEAEAATPSNDVPASAHSMRTRSAAIKPNRETEHRSNSAGPLSIVPSGEREREARIPEPNTRLTMARSETPTSLTGGSANPASAHGGYTVQVSSQRSEAEALAAYRSLQGKYPQQLGNRRPIVRRAELGSKGVFYRALVGPFGSAQQAASLCSSLKAAGGSCLIERN